MTRRTVRPPAAGSAPLSGAVISGGLVFVSGQTAADVVGFENQVQAVLDKLGALLREAGSSYEDVLRCTVYLADIRNRDQMNRVYAKFFSINPPAPPPSNAG
jgi:enamine deaminase RidA (YjgF/YER057c/UK114 family)